MDLLRQGLDSPFPPPEGQGSASEVCVRSDRNELFVTELAGEHHVVHALDVPRPCRWRLSLPQEVVQRTGHALSLQS